LDGRLVALAVDLEPSSIEAPTNSKPMIKMLRIKKIRLCDDYQDCECLDRERKVPFVSETAPPRDTSFRKLDAIGSGDAND
jgi:hypothetical protein